jgi:hypothetical protein
MDVYEKEPRRATAAAPWLLGLVCGLIIGIAGTLLIPKLWQGNESVPEQLVDALNCPTPIPQTAAAAHHADEGPNGYSWFAATHADEISYAGCDTGPGTLYLHFPNSIEMGHVLASLRHFGAVCVVGNGVFEGTILNGRVQLEELCRQLGGSLDILEAHKRVRAFRTKASGRQPST